MKRRNILHTGMAAMLLLSVSACEDFKFGNDFLDKPITTDVTIDTVFSRKVYAEQALAEIYRSLPDSSVAQDCLPTFSPQAEDYLGRH